MVFGTSCSSCMYTLAHVRGAIVCAIDQTHTHPLLAIVGGVDSGIQEYNVFAPLKASVSVPSIKNPYPGYCVSCYNVCILAKVGGKMHV
jgi:hypothetical protein